MAAEKSLKSINPLSGEVVGEVPVTSPDTIQALVQASSLAQKEWSKMDVRKRAETLKPVVEVLRARQDELGLLMTQEMGKPIKSAKGEVAACANVVERELDEMVEAFSPKTKDHGKYTETLHFDSLGVSAAITPWNFPLLMPVWQILPSLMAGNTVLFKPSEEVPLIGQALAEIMNEFLPKSVLSVVHGAGEQGKALVAAKEVRLITFTGSRATGLHILREASADMKRVILELGGKDPLVVLPGADLSAAAKFAVGNGFRNSGQVCVSTERVYVEQSVFKDFQTELLKETQALHVGDGREEETDMGPMVNERQKKIVVDQLEAAKASGATVLFQGEKSDGNFVPPTILTDVDHTMSVMKDETFGPVLGVMPFASMEEAVELANDTPYGLGAAVFGPPENAEAVALKLDSGMVGINKGVSGVPSSPWVGAKESGYGFHSSEMGHHQFCQVRVLTKVK